MSPPSPRGAGGQGRIDPVRDTTELDRSLIHGLAWTGGVKWSSQLLMWGATIVVARLIRPEDYGLVGMATIYLGLVTILTQFGFSTAIVTLRSLSERQLAQLYGVALGLGVSSCALSFVAAPLLARFFSAPELESVVVAMSVGFIFGSLRSVPQALLQRELRWRLLAVIEALQSLGRAALLVGLAAAGFGYWALVGGSVGGDVLFSALVLTRRRHRIAWPRPSEIGPAMRFSWHIFVSRLSWYVFSHADFAVAGRMLGTAPLGAYSLAWTLASMPVEKVTGMVTRLTPSYFAEVQDDPAALRRYLLRLTEGIALFTFPASIGLALVAPTAVPVLIGDHWLPAVAPLQLLAFYASFRSIRNLVPRLLPVTGHTRFGMWMAVLSAVVLPLAFVYGARWGTVGIAAAWIVAHPLVTLPVYVVAFRAIDLPAEAYLRALWPAASTVVPMAFGIWGAMALEPPDWHPVARLALEVGAGAVGGLGAVALLHRGRLASLRRTLRSGPPAVGPSPGDPAGS